MFAMQTANRLKSVGFQAVCGDDGFDSRRALPPRAPLLLCLARGQHRFGSVTETPRKSAAFPLEKGQKEGSKNGTKDS
jgi:hypothetical protein